MGKIMIGTDEVLKIMYGTDEVSSLAVGDETIPITPTPPPQPVNRIISLTNIPDLIAGGDAEAVCYALVYDNDDQSNYAQLDIYFDNSELSGYTENVSTAGNFSAFTCTYEYSASTFTVEGALPTNLYVVCYYYDSSCYETDYSTVDSFSSTTALTETFTAPAYSEICECLSQGKDWDYDNNVCVCPDQACTCSENGGTWVDDGMDGYCDCNADPACECAMNGGTWDDVNQECVQAGCNCEPECMCQEAGGEWMGYCECMGDPECDCVAQGGVWTYDGMGNYYCDGGCGGGEPDYCGEDYDASACDCISLGGSWEYDSMSDEYYCDCNGDPECECIQGGGTWDGSECQYQDYMQ